MAPLTRRGRLAPALLVTGLILAAANAPDRLSAVLQRTAPEGFTGAAVIARYGTTERPGRDGTIFDYIDGGGVVYLRHGFRELLHAEYGNGTGDRVTVDVYTFATAGQARDALADEAVCPPAAGPMPDGSTGKAYRFPPDFFFYFTSGRRLAYLHVGNDALAGALLRFGGGVRAALDKETP